MRRTSLADFHCSVARTADVIGEWWTPLIVRDAFYGRRRFEDFQRSLGLARNVLAARLDRLVESGIMERQRYQEHPPRDEYVLTEKGRDLFPVIAAMLAWGDRWTAGEAGPPLLLVHETCGKPGTLRATCDQCGEPLSLANIQAVPGPGA
jgi:DNA-binding HxlR family transcriptional regulator